MPLAAPAFAAAPTGVTGTTSAAHSRHHQLGGGLRATSYNVYRGATSGAETSLATGITGTSYNDAAATQGTTYYYTVTAVSSGVESAQSAEVIVDPVNTARLTIRSTPAAPAVAPFAADAYFSSGFLGGFTTRTT